MPGTCDTGWEPRDLDVHAGLTYHLELAGPPWTGRFPFTVEAVLPPANDNFEPRRHRGPAVPGRANLAAATFEKGEPEASCDLNYGSPSV